MSGIETNVFPLLNLEDLSARYKLYKIKGLNQNASSGGDESYRKINALITKLSFLLQIPVTYIEEDAEFFLVVRDDAKNVPESVDVVRTRLYLEELSQTFDVNYTKRSRNNDRVSVKFLQFLLRTPLERDRRLWSPGAGRPFYDITAYPISSEILQYTGFKPRIMITHDGGIGICIDITHKHVSQTPAPTYLSRKEFSRLEKRHFIYHFGYRWYEIKADYLDQLNVSESTIDTQDGLVPTLDYIYENSEKPFPQELVNLPTDASVIGYHNNRGEPRKAPAALCYKVFGPHDWIMKKHHHKSILPSPVRRELIQKYHDEHFNDLYFGDTGLKVSEKPLIIPARKFVVPDFEFANNRILSVRGTQNSQHVSLDNLGTTRLSLLKDGPGFFDNKPLNYHYVVLPYTVANSYGERFTADLKEMVDRFFPQESGFTPQVILYDDRGEKIWPEQAAAIKAAVQKKCSKEGYAVVMIHMTEDRKLRDEDTLAAAVMKELHELNIYSTVIHTSFTKNCYKSGRGKDGTPYCRVFKSQQNRLSGYLQGVALNKVLLNDFRTPFKLATELHADITIGIDVKNHTAGFVVVGKNGDNVRFNWDFEQNEKEKISYKRMKKCVRRLLQKEIDDSERILNTIVFHRDGRFYQSETDGINDAINELKLIGVLPADFVPTLVEIHKNSEAPFRLFEVNRRDFERDQVLNPQVGYYYIPDAQNAYLCSTGRAFGRHKGTVNPLHIKFIGGSLDFEKCLEDIYFLTTLTWTNPRDCLREPITIKLTDRYLTEEAGLYSKNDLDVLYEVKKVNV